jgi:hypothetical protein
MALPQDSASAAGALLAQKATFIANQLGLDPSLPLSELMAAASKKMGVATNVSSDEMHKADALISSARQTGAVQTETLGQGGGTCTCHSCGQAAMQVCSVNGCCARCVYEVAHFDKIGHSAISTEDEQELGQAGGPRGLWAFPSRSNLSPIASCAPLSWPPGGRSHAFSASDVLFLPAAPSPLLPHTVQRSPMAS